MICGGKGENEGSENGLQKEKLLIKEARFENEEKRERNEDDNRKIE